ncbi:lichenan-specific phosphotransferase enzyme iia component [Treponema primitia ZAS-2]|uniref:Lichenan-specific phosphotransferase enzyme iia component n=1 Tax=Treponema primitia (strain ATCC BAA-887 / DSM 12427 / ZAS-2) TaxID=545694 RepID=F5YM40_TREPZ|nr:PTS lactose/cellobiose transporter subunit IIA [Treponema primitia]AEF83994.1 lichenan-specific phosphotransferase enzyme iia component [Treponema primitia ZAS-2]
MGFEEEAMQLIVNAGNAKSHAMTAISRAKEGKPDQAQQELQESDEAMTIAHRHQTEILQMTLDDPDQGMGMIMVHAQDHLMAAVTILDMAREFCDLYALIHKQGLGGRV